jgi:HD-like signal output (HDOD) protein/DNA-binding NarL/FixJ family response regulator
MAAHGKPRILFVDDEQNILQSLKRWAVFNGAEWDIRFAESGRQALGTLAKEPVDIVISDMRMPEMNGAELLERVRAGYPDTVRIILSGHSDKDLIVKAFSVTHRFLPKPVDMAFLKTFISDILKYRACLDSPALRAGASAFSRMPVTLRSREALDLIFSDSEGGNVEQLARLIEKDTFVSTKVMQLVYFLLPDATRKICGVRQALAALGVETFRSLVLADHAILTYPDGSEGEKFLTEMSEHGVQTARLAREVVMAASGDSALAENAYVAGLLHDIGFTVFLDCMPFGSLNDAINKEDLFPSHGEIGGYLLGVWGFPIEIVEAVTFHHHPRRAERGASALVTAAVHVADAILRKCTDKLDWTLLGELGWAKGMRAWKDHLTHAGAR